MKCMGPNTCETEYAMFEYLMFDYALCTNGKVQEQSKRHIVIGSLADKNGPLLVIWEYNKIFQPLFILFKTQGSPKTYSALSLTRGRLLHGTKNWPLII